jgi:hypothetical protein
MRSMVKKLLLLILNCLLKVFSLPTLNTQSISLIPTESGFNIYNSKGELLLQLTRSNTDSLSLEKLKYIYDIVKEGEVIKTG